MHRLLLAAGALASALTIGGSAPAVALLGPCGAVVDAACFYQCGTRTCACLVWFGGTNGTCVIGNPGIGE